MHCLRKLDPNTIITINVNNEASNKNTATHTTKSGLRVINGKLFLYPIGRRGGLMVSALDSGSGGPGSSLAGALRCVLAIEEITSGQFKKNCPQKFYLSARKRNGTFYNKKSLSTIRAALDRQSCATFHSLPLLREMRVYSQARDLMVLICLMTN